MDPLTSAAASGMRTTLESLDMIANNLANAQTTGYKLDREFYDLYTSADAGTDSVDMPDISQNWTDFSQGTLLTTANSLDLAISGDGLFAVMGASGTLYTRNGAFRLDPNGRLVTSEGYPVQGKDGKAIQLDSTQPVNVDPSGAILQSGAEVARLNFASFTAPEKLAKQGANYFTFAGDATEVTAATGQIQQGKLEASNVSAAESAVRLVSVMRQFEMLQKAIGIGADMNRQAIEEVAKSGQ